ncbi:MAG: hypothetical protein Fur0043_23210 [Anaerolineales bacterium]
MNVVDSSGWIEYFLQGGNAAFFIPPIRDVENLLVPSICIYEVCKRLLADVGEEAALQAVGVMLQGQEIPIERTIAIEAARLSRDLKLGMADSLIYATARAHHATLWTQDEHFGGLEGVKYIPKR